MSTFIGEQKRRRARRRLRWVRAKQRIVQSYTVVRPVLLLAALGAGLWLAVPQLMREPWHHNALVWILGAGVAAWGGVGLYHEVQWRVALRQWIRDPNDYRVMDVEPEIRKMVGKLPPWHHPRFVARRRAAREATGRH